MKLFRRRRNSTWHHMMTAFLIPVSAVCAMLFVSWWSGDFWTYVDLLLLENPDSNNYHDDVGYTPPTMADGEIIDDTDEDQGTLGDGFSSSESTSSGMGFTGGSGNSSGLNLAKISDMIDGYCRDYLEILRDHCNWKYMRSEVKLMDDPLPMEPILSAAVSESGADSIEVNGTKFNIPASTINPEDYKKVDGLNFYTVNSAWFSEKGMNYVSNTATDPSNMQWGDPSSDGGGSAHTTVFQFDKNWFNLYPAGAIGGNTTNLPSTLNTGYGLTEGTTREPSQNDAAYLPDQFSTYIQSAPKRLLQYTDASMLNNQTLALGAMHVGHHGDASVLDIGSGCGRKSTSLGKVSSNSPNTRKQGTAGMLNLYSDMLQKVYSYFGSHMNDADFKWSWNNEQEYSGLGVGLFLKGYNGFFKFESDRQDVISRFNKNDSWGPSFRRGVIMGFSVIEGRPVSESEVLDYLKSDAVVKENLGSGYPSNLNGYYYGVGVYWFHIYLQDPNVNLIYEQGDGSAVPALHCWNRITLKMAFMDPIYGSYLYWKMLQASGVDCTYNEVLSSGTAMLEEIPVVVPDMKTESDPNNEFWFGLNLYDKDGHVIASSINELERQLTLEVLATNDSDVMNRIAGSNGLRLSSGSGSGEVYDTATIKAYLTAAQSTLCDYHYTNRYNTAGGYQGYPSTTMSKMNGRDVNNTASYLQCTWWASGRAKEYIDKKFPSNSSKKGSIKGSGGKVTGNMKSAGFNTGSKPKAGCVAVVDYDGHVEFVEAVDSNGTYFTSAAGSGRSWMGIVTVTGGVRNKWSNYYPKQFAFPGE